MRACLVRAAQRVALAAAVHAAERARLGQLGGRQAAQRARKYLVCRAVQVALQLAAALRAARSLPSGASAKCACLSAGGRQAAKRARKHLVRRAVQVALQLAAALRAARSLPSAPLQGVPASQLRPRGARASTWCAGPPTSRCSLLPRCIC